MAAHFIPVAESCDAPPAKRAVADNGIVAQLRRRWGIEPASSSLFQAGLDTECAVLDVVHHLTGNIDAGGLLDAFEAGRGIDFE